MLEHLTPGGPIEVTHNNQGKPIIPGAALHDKEEIKMKIYTEESLNNFEFWDGAKDRVKYLTESELETIEAILEDCAPEDGYSDTAINDFFWFEDDTIAEWLGYDDFDQLMEERDNAAQA